ncbi:uncharacterized protein LOC100120966 [Nasonia vitripennis]|uniref:Putative odorant binding protein 46 n=1 Tax=Nasonia vitripennis TaxID=7425 RepID=G8B1Q1_NASVI|nr:uncharacterized protein LOC100120966 [Nasonia vitripennis]CCD17815.1 putative odorant binding protein 46 [Nasonia vitripennis]
MKRFLILFIFCLTSPLGRADIYDDTVTCLKERGLKETDIRILDAVGEPGNEHILKDAPKDKLVDAIACIFRKDHKTNKALFGTLTELINMDSEIDNNKRKELLVTLNACNKKTDGNDTNLLKCLEATQPPFDKYAAIIRDVTNVIKECFFSNKLTFSDLRYRKMLHRESVSEVLKHVGEDNITCAMTCEFDKNKHVYKDMDPNETIHKRLETLITKSSLPEEKKREMKETLDRCDHQARGDSCKFGKCVKLMRPPFVQLYFKNP